jgi:hypothetical protein
MNNINYEATNNLMNNIDKELFLDLFNNVKICAYQILNKDVNPFLQFLLVNDETNSNILSFPSVNILNITEKVALSDTQDLLSYIQSFLGEISENLSVLENNNFMGFYLDKKSKTLFMFYDLSDCQFNISLVYKKSKLWFCLVDEIINKQHVCGININSSVTNFFLLNQEFITLTNDLGHKIEHPVACYIKKEKKLLNFTHYFGLPKMDITQAFLGPYYYFNDFDNALYSINDDKKGLIRFAVFLGKMLVKLNYPEDSIDNSDLKREKLNGSVKEQLTMRVTDYNGIWTENYDSCFIGKIKLDNGDILGNTPVFVVKNYEQQFSLSYHYINSENTDII